MKKNLKAEDLKKATGGIVRPDSTDPVRQEPLRAGIGGGHKGIGGGDGTRIGGGWHVGVAKGQGPWWNRLSDYFHHFYKVYGKKEK